VFLVIFSRELREHLASFRFGAVFVLTQLLMVTSVLVFATRYETAMAEYRPVDNLTNDEGLVNLQGIPCKGGIRLQRRPSRLGFLASAGEQELPDGVRLAVHGIDAITNSGDPADLLASATPVDWTWSIAVLLSFAAGLLTYRSISGEREDGTLAMTLTNSVSRGVLLAGKYAAALSALVMSLAVGTMLSMLLLILYGTINLTPADWLRLAAVIGIAALFLSCFVLIGLVCSVTSRSSTISAILFLGVWAVLVFVLPNAAGILAPRLVAAPTPGQVRRQAQAAEDNLPLVPGMSLEQVASTDTDRHLAREGVLLTYVQQLSAQVDGARHVARLSPVATFRFAAEAAGGGGLLRLRSFLDNAARYRARLFDAVMAADRQDPDSEHRYRPWYCGGSHFSQRTVDLGTAAQFDDQALPPAAALAAATLDVVLLLLYNAILLLWAFVAFVRQDVTPGSAA
jgi:ABC-type transport system involved in multi-copper enzyme maturation permease subunit